MVKPLNLKTQDGKEFRQKGGRDPTLRRLRVLPVQSAEPRHRRPHLFTPRISICKGSRRRLGYAGDPELEGEHLPADLVCLRGLFGLHLG